MESYDHKKIEKKWQDKWEADAIYCAKENSTKPKKFVLDMFPYPSGEGLHVGHPKGYIATDIYSRSKRMQGFNVLHSMGWDAFGLPAEQYAIKNKVHPRVAVDKNTKRYKEQLSIIGFDYDWKREINTTDPEFYKWTQWIFLKMFEKGLAYESYEPINWCPTCQTGLANEDLEGGACERCDTPVEKKPMRQWVLRITDYADRMLADLDNLDWPTSIKEAQKNWIGRSEGAIINFKLQITNYKTDTKDTEIKEVEVFTTRPDTLFGATYCVLAPEHKLVDELKESVTNWGEVEKYREESKARTEIERTAEGREKTGVRLEGVSAVNPANGEELPVFVADYVLGHYGTGAVMAVPAHDERDFEFAKKFGLPIKQVINPLFVDKGNPPQSGFAEVVRPTVIVFLRDKETDEYALLEWHGTLEGITTAVMGGQEDGDTIEETAKKEIIEETGFIEHRFVKASRWVSKARYCASHKKENRCALASVVLFEIENKNARQNIVSEKEKKIHTLFWVPKDNVRAELVPEHQKFAWDQIHLESALTQDGDIINSEEFDGVSNEDAKRKITDFVKGRWVTKYRLKDWVFSRQRYWGEPIPLIHCEKCGVVAVPEKDLPLLLPEVESYEPTGTGESPLANIAEWVTVSCPKCGGAGKRETNTMPQWAGSSWYYLRFIDPHNTEALVDKEKEKYWSPVDMYVGGAEHATRHLIYARFYHKFLFDIGVVNYEEPFIRLHNVGLIMGADGRKMSKRWGNVVNPDDMVASYGADTLRLYEMFLGPFGQSSAWSTESIIGPRRFLERVWKLKNKLQQTTDNEQQENQKLDAILHKTIKKVTDDIESFSFNTAISTMMILVNEMEKATAISREHYEIFLKLLAPFAPHITEELWHTIGNTESVHLSLWPVFDGTKIVASEVTIAIQVNGKMRDTIVVPADAEEDVIKGMALARPAVAKWVDGKDIKKVIVVKGKIINIVVGEIPL